MEAAPAAPEPTEQRPAPFSPEVLARELNPAQLEAVLRPPGPMVVVAGAGSGKTRVITYRLARLVATGADPRRIVAVTFTNKAAGELRERVDKLLWERMKVGSRGLWVGTFHAISARILRTWGEAVGLRKDFVIYDDDDQKRLLGRVLTDLKVPERMFPVRQVLSAIDRAKNNGTTADSFNSDDYFDDVIGKAYKLYEERLAAANATDFGGLLMKTLQLVASQTPAALEIAQRFDHVLVDEFQDTNSVQYRLVQLLSRQTGSITVVGDEDQSIYRWRGADIRNILDFERDHPGAFVVKLEQNYRSTGNILRAANAIIEKNSERRPKRLFTESGDGDPLIVFEGETERDEAEFVASRIEDALSTTLAPRDFAVFYRTNAQSRVLEDALRARNLPYSVVGGTRFFDRAEIKNLISYLRAIANPDDGLALQRIINVPARGIGSTTTDRIGDLIYERKISAWQTLELVSTDEELRRLPNSCVVVADGSLGRSPAGRYPLQRRAVSGAGGDEFFVSRSRSGCHRRPGNAAEIARARRSRTSSPAAPLPSPTRTTAWRCSGSSTSRRGGSARRRPIGSATSSTNGRSPPGRRWSWSRPTSSFWVPGRARRSPPSSS